MISFFKKKTPVREHILSSGEKIRIRQLSPAERMSSLSLPGDIDLCKRLSAGLVSPKLSRRKAKKLLENEPFKALEILRAIQIFGRDCDLAAQAKWHSLQDEQFLETLKHIETLKNNP